MFEVGEIWFSDEGKADVNLNDFAVSFNTTGKNRVTFTNIRWIELNSLKLDFPLNF